MVDNKSSSTKSLIILDFAFYNSGKIKNNFNQERE